MVCLQLGRYVGFGEAPAIAYYDITVEKMIEDIEAKKRMIEKFAFTEPERYWHYLHHLIPNNPFLVRCIGYGRLGFIWQTQGQIIVSVVEYRVCQHTTYRLHDWN